MSVLPYPDCPLIELNEHFSALAPHYDVVLSDVWGVLHNGEAAWREASEALARFREAGGAVVLITNAPRPGDYVIRQMDRLGVWREAYDGIVSSGDITRGVIARRPGQTIYHIGPDRNLAIFKGIEAPLAPVQVADYVICSGLVNDSTETADDYRDLLTTVRARELFMVCSNPDVIVEVGERMIYCAGAIADLYAAMGGEVLYAGKPYAGIYEEALAIAARARGKPIDRARVLAIGDSVRTDLKGATAFGIDCLFVTSGIHAEEFGQRDAPDPDAVARAFVDAGAAAPRAVTRKLRW
ncbi:MAG: TIGR01459 family HAD-type hydrolase [Pseudorhodoplanes sp.]